MKKSLMKFSKRAFALVMAAAMVFSNSFVVSAAETTKATELSGAYDGTPSKVIGLEGNADYSGLYNADGNLVAAYTKVDWEATTRTPIMAGNDDVAKTYYDTTNDLYLYNGVYYAGRRLFSIGGNPYFYFCNPIIFYDGTQDPTTNLYVANGKYYRYSYTMADGRKYVWSDEEVFVYGIYANYNAFKAAHYVQYKSYASSSWMNTYYQKDGRIFSSYSSKSVTGGYVYYTYASNELLLNTAKPYFNWNDITTYDKYVTSDNKIIKVAYEIELDGNICPYDYDDYWNYIITADGKFLYKSSGYAPHTVLKAGESSTIRVRAVYYTETETVDATGKTITTYNTYKTGAWSEPYTYKFNGLTSKTIPALSVTAQQKDDYVKVSWGTNADVKTYQVQYIYSNTPITVDSTTWNKYYNGYSEVWDPIEATNPNLDWYSGYTTTSKSYVNLYTHNDYIYTYYMVRPYTLLEDYDIINYTYSNVAAVQVVPEGIKIPALSNFKAIKKVGTTGVTLSWTPVDANVVVYAYEKKDFPAYYNYDLLDAYAKITDANGNVSTEYLSNNIDEVTKKIIDKEVYSQTADGEDGEVTFYLEAGKKYYFVAHTYDKKDSDIAKATPIATIDNVAYNYYTSFGPATKIVSAKATVGEPGVVTLSGKTSIKLSLSHGSTGYEIYRKSGKKWKKLTTTIDNHYIDEGLKQNTKYSYKVRSYYYNEDSKVKAYSDYVYLTATTGTVNGIMLTVTKKSTKSAKLTWNKITGATKYEIYRSNEYSGDPSKLYEKYSSGNWKNYLQDYKYELIKTINKASTTSYTNSGLAAGEDYSYVIMAYFKNGKKTAYVSDYASVSMEVNTPADVATVNKGTTVKVTWTKDPYAKKYEVAYMKYDKYGNTDAKLYTIKTTTKNSYTISGVAKGGYAYVKVRAIGKNGRYSSWSSVEQGVSLAGAKSVKATNVLKTTASGKQVAAVKISWKKVSGAKYYKVYRTTKMPTYYADTKMYAASGSTIAKESNDDEGYYDEVKYNQIYNIEDSITKTSAIDYAQLDAGVDYYYTVVAYGEYGTQIASYASYDNDTVTYGSASYGKVTYNNKVTIAAKATKKKVTLSWNKIPGVTKYVVYRSTKKNGKYTKIATVKKGKATYTDKKVSKGKTYYYKIVATGTNILKNKFEVTSNIKKVKVPKK